jgi:predicted transcriptional regulator
MLTPLELDIMKAVWQRRPITVKDVQIEIHAARPLAYTTVMTIMHRLYLKGFLHRTLKSRTHYYEPAVDFADVRDAAVGGMIDHFFQGSRDKFIQFMNQGYEDEREEVREISGPVAFDESLL